MERKQIIEILDSWGLREQFIEDGFDMLVQELASTHSTEISEERIEELWYKHCTERPRKMMYSGFKAAIEELNQ